MYPRFIFVLAHPPNCGLQIILNPKEIFCLSCFYLSCQDSYMTRIQVSFLLIRTFIFNFFFSLNHYCISTKHIRSKFKTDSDLTSSQVKNPLMFLSLRKKRLVNVFANRVKSSYVKVPYSVDLQHRKRSGFAARKCVKTTKFYNKMK